MSEKDALTARMVDLNRVIGVKWGDKIIDPKEIVYVMREEWRELTDEESAALAAKRIREALANSDHLGPLLDEALVLLRRFEREAAGE